MTTNSKIEMPQRVAPLEPLFGEQRADEQRKADAELTAWLSSQNSSAQQRPAQESK